MSVSPGRHKASLPSRLGDRLLRILPLLTALPQSHLPLLGEWARQVSSEREARDRRDALHRAHRRAEADIRAALIRLAAAFDVPGHDVNDAMASVGGTREALTGEVARDLADELEQADQY